MSQNPFIKNLNRISEIREKSLTVYCWGEESWISNSQITITMKREENATHSYKSLIDSIETFTLIISNQKKILKRMWFWFTKKETLKDKKLNFFKFLFLLLNYFNLNYTNYKNKRNQKFLYQMHDFQFWNCVFHSFHSILFFRLSKHSSWKRKKFHHSLKIWKRVNWIHVDFFSFNPEFKERWNLWE